MHTAKGSAIVVWEDVLMPGEDAEETAGGGRAKEMALLTLCMILALYSGFRLR